MEFDLVYCYVLVRFVSDEQGPHVTGAIQAGPSCGVWRDEIEVRLHKV